MGSGLSDAREADAGKQILRDEYGGDLAKAKAGVASIRAQAAKATSTEARKIDENHANLIEAAIKAAEQKTAGGLSDAAPANPSGKPAAGAKPSQSVDMDAAAVVKANLKAGRITREEAIKQLRKLGLQ